MMTRSRFALALVVLAGVASQAAAQSGTPVPEWMKGKIISPDDPRLKPYRDLRKKQVALEKELKKLRAKHFRAQHKPTREAGLKTLAEYNQPWMVQPLIEVFQEDQGADVREAIVTILRTQASDEGDRGLAWLACGNEDPAWNQAAIDGLSVRLKDLKQKPTSGMLAVFQGGVASKTQRIADASARAVAGLDLYEMIPFLIQAQAPAPPATSPIGRPRNGPLAWVAIAQQQAYIADLEPIVADNAVAFNPVPGVVSSGVVLVINDAAVTFSPVVIHQSLVRLANKAMAGAGGQPTDGLRLNTGAWKDWYFAAGEKAIAKAVEERTASEKPADKSAAPAVPSPTSPTSPASPAATAPAAPAK